MEQMVCPSPLRLHGHAVQCFAKERMEIQGLIGQLHLLSVRQFKYLKFITRLQWWY